MISLQPNYLQKGSIGDAHSLVCSISFSSTVQPSSVNLTWNFFSNDNRVTVIPATITTNNSIGNIYTTVIQFAYLIEEDVGSYICILTIDGYSLKSSFSLQLIGKCNLLILCIKVIVFIVRYVIITNNTYVLLKF